MIPDDKSISEIHNSHPSAERIPKSAVADANAGASWTQSDSSAGEAAGGGADFSRYLHAFRRRWLIAVVIALPVAALATSAVWIYQPKVYTSTATLRMAAAERTLIFDTVDSRAGASTFDVYKKTQRQLLRSRFVVTRALQDGVLAKLPVFQDQPDPVEWLENNLIVKFLDESEIIQISLSAKDPEGLHQLITAVVDAYFQEIVFVERDRKLDRRSKLDTALKNVETELRSKRNDLAQLVEKVGSGDSTALTLTQQSLLQQFIALRQRFTQSQFELMQAESQLELIMPSENPEGEVVISESELELAIQNDRVAEQLNAEKQEILNRIRETETRVKEGVAARKLEEHNRRLEICDTRFEARKQALRQEMIEHMKQYAAAGTEELKRKVAQLAAQEKQLEKKLQEMDLESRKFGRSSVEVELLRAELAGLQDVKKSIGTELERTKVELQADSKSEWMRVTRLSDAQPARTEDPKSRLTKTTGAGVLSLLLPILFFVWLDARKDRINSHREVTDGLGLSVIGSLPLIPRRRMLRLGGATEQDQFWRSLLSESVDSIAAVLLRGTKSGTHRAVMVSSATAGEGKSTLASHLATSLAGAGRRTILVDFDLRRPALHRVFDLPLQPGLNDVLRETSALDAVIQLTQIPNLTFLSAGRRSSTGLAGLAVADLKSLFDRFRAQFDFVVVDGSPILPVVDTRLIAQHVDGVLLSVLRDVSRVPQVRGACQLMEQFGIPVLGVVITGSSWEVYKYSRYELYTSTQAVG